jgi:hypothetical protein
MAYVRNFSALTTGIWRWNKAEPVGTPTVVTYSFLERAELPDFGESPPVPAASGNRYVAMTAGQRSAVRDALKQFEARSGLRFLEVDDPADASIKFHGNQSRNLTSWAYLPQTPSVNGAVQTGDGFVTITYDPAQSWTLSSARGSSIYTVMLHEIGHAIGLEHPHERVLLTPSMDNHDHTIMSYDWTWSGSGTGRTRDTLGPLDQQAIRHLYGDAAGFTAVWRSAGQFIVIDGGAGDDRIVTGRAPSLMSGGTGDDRLTGAQFDDTLKGGSGNDVLKGGGGNDQISGHLGRDGLSGGAGNDLLVGGDGNDRLSGGALDDRLYGGLGADTLAGDLGNDWLDGGPQDDRLGGGGGDDTLIGGAGNDRLAGGPGADVFSFRGTIGRDVIEDWSDGTDRIILRGYTAIDDLADVLAMSRQEGADVVIRLGGGSVLIFEDTALAELGAGDFTF